MFRAFLNLHLQLYFRFWKILYFSLVFTIKLVYRFLYIDIIVDQKLGIAQGNKVNGFYGILCTCILWPFGWNVSYNIYIYYIYKFVFFNINYIVSLLYIKYLLNMMILCYVNMLHWFLLSYCETNMSKIVGKGWFFISFS